MISSRSRSAIAGCLAVSVLACIACDRGAKPSSAMVSSSIRYRIQYATYIGGSEYDDAREVISLEDGSLVLGGQTVSPDFPVTKDALQRRYGGEPAGTGHPGVYGGDCWVARLDAGGTRILAATYFGGSKQERDVYGMALDRKGNITITTTTRSDDIPTTEGAFQRKYAGGAADWVAAKFSPDLKRILWSTYIGGSGEETPRGGLALDSDDNVYIVGTTASPDFPRTPGAIGPVPGRKQSAAVVKLRPDGSDLVWSGLLGGGSNNGIIGVRVDANGNVYLAGHTDAGNFPVTEGAAQARHGGLSDCFLAALSPDAARLHYCTYLGGRADEFAEHRLALLPDGSVLLTGVTASKDFPVTSQAFQQTLKGETNGFVTKLSPDGRKIVFSTFLGGSGGEFFLMPTTDAEGNIYVAGYTASEDFPVTTGAIRGSLGGKSDGVFAVLSPDGSRLLYSTYLGGKNDDLLRSIALGKNGEVYLIGKTESKDFPATPGVAQSRYNGGADAFVMKLVREP